MVMRKEGRRMGKCELSTCCCFDFCFCFLFQEHPLEETTGNVLVSLVRCKALCNRDTQPLGKDS